MFDTSGIQGAVENGLSSFLGSFVEPSGEVAPTATAEQAATPGQVQKGVAPDGSTITDDTAKEKPFYMKPIVWIIAIGIIFMLLILLLVFKSKGK